MRIKLDFELIYLLSPNMNNNHKLEQMVFQRAMEENMKDSIRGKTIESESKTIDVLSNI